MELKINWQNCYSDTDEPDKKGRWMRVGMVHGVTVAMMTQGLNAYHNYIYRCEVPSLEGKEWLLKILISNSEEKLKRKVEEHIEKYVNRLNGNYERKIIDKLREEYETTN